MSVPRHLRLDPRVARRRLPSSGGEIAALVASPEPNAAAARTPVLCVPGYTGSKEDFLHLLPLLADAGYPASAIDLPGQYESERPDDPSAYTLARLGDAVGSLVQTPVHLVGHSFGGLVCREAVLAGARVRSLTLLGSGPAALRGTRGELVELMRPILLDEGVPAVWAASSALDATKPGADQVPADVRAFLERRFLASPAAALIGMGEALVGAPDRVAELRDSGVPTFVLHGDADDAWLPDEQQQMAERLGARHATIVGAGHSPAVEATEATVDALLDFFAAVDGR